MLFSKKLRLLTAFALGTGFISGCENVVEIPIPEHTPKLALRCSISNEPLDSAYFQLYPDNIPFVSASRGILSSQSSPPVTNALMQITDGNGVVVESFMPGFKNQPGSENSGYYSAVSNFKPQPGQTYKLKVSAPGFEEVTGQLVLPNVLSGMHASFTGKQTDPYTTEGSFSFTIQDNGAEDNYYFIQVFALDSLQRLMPNVTVREEKDDEDFSTDLNDIQLSSMYSQIYPFDDKTFNGRSFTTTHNIVYSYYYDGSGNNPKVKYLRAVVASITKDKFLFHKSIDTYYDTHDNPFSEPTRIQGNLKNGYGYFGGQTNSYFDIKLPE